MGLIGFTTNQPQMFPRSASLEVGLVPNLPHLVTIRPPGAPMPDFTKCGQIAFVPTFQDGAPDPNAPPYYLQINSGCPKVTFGLQSGELVTDEPHHTPELNTFDLVGWALILFFVVPETLKGFWRAWRIFQLLP